MQSKIFNLKGSYRIPLEGKVGTTWRLWGSIWSFLNPLGFPMVIDISPNSLNFLKLWPNFRLLQYGTLGAYLPYTSSPLEKREVVNGTAAAQGSRPQPRFLTRGAGLIFA